MQAGGGAGVGGTAWWQGLRLAPPPPATPHIKQILRQIGRQPSQRAAAAAGGVSWYSQTARIL